jgi:NitT/TauT family transport system permease protein
MMSGGTTTADRRSPRLATVGTRAREAFPAFVVLVVTLAIWEVWASSGGLSIVPPPSEIAAAARDDVDLLLTGARATLIEAIGGLILGSLGGLAVGFAAARWVTARDILLPLAIGASTIPLIAVAPIANNWFGALNPFAKMAMAALLVFFPVTVNVTRGLVDVPPSALELMRSYAASEGETMRKVRIPNMLPYLFTALKVGTTLAFIGAIVAEYFGGSPAVLGYVVLNSMYAGRFDLAWAGILIGSLAAITAYVVVSATERVVIPWYVALRSGEP